MHISTFLVHINPALTDKLRNNCYETSQFLRTTEFRIFLLTKESHGHQFQLRLAFLIIYDGSEVKLLAISVRNANKENIHLCIEQLTVNLT
jgi:hypothetical protein